jgi:L-lactate dehydrogenase complex protein LldE
MTSIRRVQLLVTCLVDRLFPDTGMATARILERLGIEVVVPAAQTCCGQPAFNAGFLEDARAMARHTVDVFAADPAPVVIPSGSCGDMVIHQYAAILADDPTYANRARDLAGRTHELTRFLVDELGVTDVGAAGDGTVAYHACCHGLRGLDVRGQPTTLLDAIRGVTRVPLPEHDVCCGFGGLFAVKMSDISSAMLNRKLDCIEKCGASTIAVTDVSCAMHMSGGLHRRVSPVLVRHVADLIDPGEPT